MLLGTAVVYWSGNHGGKMTFDRLRERELFTHSEVVKERMCAGGQPHGACLPGITPGGTNDCLELRPLLTARAERARPAPRGCRRCAPGGIRSLRQATAEGRGTA
jgi:hypothetical protein